MTKNNNVQIVRRVLANAGGLVHSSAEIEAALNEADGSIDAAAETLGIGFEALHRHVSAYGLWPLVKTDNDELLALARAGLEHYLKQSPPPEWAVKFAMSRMAPEANLPQHHTVDFTDAKAHLQELLQRHDDTDDEG